MKKSVVVLISIIYIAAIFVVGFIGAKRNVFNEMIYITDIECTNEGIMDLGNNHKEIMFDYDEDKSIEENALIITYKVFPSDSTFKGADAVDIYAIPNDLLFEQDGVVFKFHNAPGIVTVQLESLDGSNIKEYVDIIVY